MGDILGGLIAPMVAGVIMWILVLKTLPGPIARATINIQKETKVAKGSVETSPSQSEPPVKMKKDPPSLIVIVVLIASFVVVGLGIQAKLNSDALNNVIETNSEHDRVTETCVKLWADEYRNATQLRVGANDLLRKKERNWSYKVGNIFTVFIQAVANPTPPGEEPDPELVAAFSTALNEFATADAELKAQQDAVDTTGNQNPYPVLDLDCPEGHNKSIQEELADR